MQWHFRISWAYRIFFSIIFNTDWNVSNFGGALLCPPPPTASLFRYMYGLTQRKRERVKLISSSCSNSHELHECVEIVYAMQCGAEEQHMLLTFMHYSCSSWLKFHFVTGSTGLWIFIIIIFFSSSANAVGEGKYCGDYAELGCIERDFHFSSVVRSSHNLWNSVLQNADKWQRIRKVIVVYAAIPHRHRHRHTRKIDCLTRTKVNRFLIAVLRQYGFVCEREGLICMDSWLCKFNTFHLTAHFVWKMSAWLRIYYQWDFFCPVFLPYAQRL